MLRSLGEICTDISKYASDGGHDFLSLLLKMAAMEAYRISDQDPRGAQIELRPPETGVFDLDISSDIIFSDSICAEFFGSSSKMTAKGVANADFINAVHPDDRDRVVSGVQHSITSGSEFDCTYRLIANDRLRWVHARAFCTLDRSGRPLRFPGVVTDVTELKSQLARI